MGKDDIAIIAGFLVDWWAARLQQGDKDAFRASLLAASIAKLSEHPERPFLSIECDYDPQDILLDAVRAAGVECSGGMFSARGILPQKHETVIYPAREAEPEFDQAAQPDRLVVKEGYGNWAEPIPLSEIIAGRRALQEGGGE